MCHFARKEGTDGKCGAIDFSIVTPAAAESYCAEAAKIPLHAAKIREETKILNTFKRIRPRTTLFIAERGKELGVRAQELFKKI